MKTHHFNSQDQFQICLYFPLFSALTPIPPLCFRIIFQHPSISITNEYSKKQAIWRETTTVAHFRTTIIHERCWTPNTFSWLTRSVIKTIIVILPHYLIKNPNIKTKIYFIFILLLVGFFIFLHKLRENIWREYLCRKM